MRCCSAFPLVPGLGSTDSAAGCPALFVGFTATMPESDFSGSCINGYGSSPSRCGPSIPSSWGAWPIQRSPGSRTRSVCTCQGLRPRRAGQTLALAHLPILPSTQLTVSAPGKTFFRGSMAGLCTPLPTLRRHPRGGLRTARGRCGSLFLHRNGLSPSTPCRSPGAPTVMLTRSPSDFFDDIRHLPTLNGACKKIALPRPRADLRKPWVSRPLCSCRRSNAPARPASLAPCLRVPGRPG